MAESVEMSSLALDMEQGVGVDLQPLFRKLKPGPGLPAEEVLEDQRRRLHGAMVALVAKEGWRGVRVRTLIQMAGVSTSTFYRHFGNADACLASTYEAVISETLQRASAAQRGETDWRASVRAMIKTLMEHFARQPEAARLVLFDIFAGGPDARRRIGSTVAALEVLLAANFATAPRTVRPPRHLVAGMTAGILRVARTTTLAGRSGELPGLADELADWILALPDPEVHSLLVTEAGMMRAGARREPHPLPTDPFRGTTAADDRARLLRAAAKLTVVDGFASLTASRLRAEAGVSRRRFDACFDSLEECFLEAVGLIWCEAANRARTWSGKESRWEHRTCRLTLGLCAQAARNRPMARLAFLGIFATGTTGLRFREANVGRLAVALWSTIPAARRPSPIVAEASVAAAWQIVQTDVAARRTRSLPLVAPLLSYVVLAPIVGASEASRAIRAEIGLPGARATKASSSLV